MNTHRSTAILVGIFFIIGTVAGVMSGLVTGPVLDGVDYLAKVAANESKIALGALLVLVMGFPSIRGDCLVWRIVRCPVIAAQV